MPSKKVKSKNKFNLILSGGLILIIFFLLIAITFIGLGQISNENSTTNETTPMAVEAGELATYKHSLGFNLTYPLVGEQIDDNCNSNGEIILNTEKRIVMDDGENIYITFPTVEVSREYNKDCEVKDVDFNLLENGWNFQNRYGQEIKNFPQSVKYTYKQIDNDFDLINLSKSVFGENCSSIDKKLIDSENKIYSVMPYNAENREPFSTGSCTLDYNFDFYYSDKQKVAIVGNKTQDVNDFIAKERVENSLGDGYRAVVTFE